MLLADCDLPLFLQQWNRIFEKIKNSRQLWLIASLSGLVFRDASSLFYFVG